MQTIYEEGLISTSPNRSHWTFCGAGWFLGDKGLCRTARPSVGELLPGLNLPEEPLSSCSSFPFLLSSPPLWYTVDAELEFPFKVGQCPLSLLLLPRSLSLSLCCVFLPLSVFPGTVPNVIPIQSASAKKKKKSWRWDSSALILLTPLQANFFFPFVTFFSVPLLMSALLHICLKPSISYPLSVHLFSSLPSHWAIHHCLCTGFQSYWNYTSRLSPACISDSSYTAGTGSLTNVLINGALKDTLTGQMAVAVIGN